VIITTYFCGSVIYDDKLVGECSTREDIISPCKACLENIGHEIPLSLGYKFEGNIKVGLNGVGCELELSDQNRFQGGAVVSTVMSTVILIKQDFSCVAK